MITGNESYYPTHIDNEGGITTRQKFLMDWVMANNSRFSYDTEHCLFEGNKAFEAYLKEINNG